MYGQCVVSNNAHAAVEEWHRMQFFLNQNRSRRNEFVFEFFDLISDVDFLVVLSASEILLNARNGVLHDFWGDSLVSSCG